MMAVSLRTGRLVTTSLAEYVVAVNADVRDTDVLFVGQPDSITPLGTKGVVELAITGMRRNCKCVFQPANQLVPARCYGQIGRNVKEQLVG
jgi:hypothetical protein